MKPAVCMFFCKAIVDRRIPVLHIDHQVGKPNWVSGQDAQSRVYSNLDALDSTPATYRSIEALFISFRSPISIDNR